MRQPIQKHLVETDDCPMHSFEYLLDESDRILPDSKHCADCDKGLMLFANLRHIIQAMQVDAIPQPES